MMKEVVIIALCCWAAVQAGARPQHVPNHIKPLSSEMADFINSLDTTWKAGQYSDEKFKTENLKSLLGVKRGPGGRKLPVKRVAVSNDLPASFDAREKWTNCPSLKEVRDQSNCGSCWAFATVESITDRTCIATKGKFTEDLSTQDLLTCCKGFWIFGCGNGCQGGFPANAWSWWVDTGLVTGGLYNGTGCQPYSFAPHHHGEDYADTPKCKETCENGADYKEDKHFGAEAYSLDSVESIKQDIFDHGPVGVDFTVYADFPSYKSGVYQSHSWESLGGHAVKLIGWGEENGTPYWLAVNSWNTEWGENGLFRILRGSNECGIENHVLGGTPKV